MRVLHLELGRHLYGGARQVAYLLDGLAAMGKDAGQHRLVCVPDSGVGNAVCEAVACVPMPFSGDLDMGFVRRLRREMNLYRPDWLHIHSRRGETLATLAAALEGIPVIYTRRVDNPPAWLDVRYKFSRYRRINCISEGIREVLLRHGVPREKLSAVRSAVDHELYRPDPERRRLFRESLAIDQAALVVGVVAQLILRKGHRILLDALDDVFAAYPGLQVLFFGKGPEAAGIQELVNARGWHDRVRLVGFHAHMEQVYPGLDLLVHPALMEGLGVSLLEASACGLPVVASSVGGIPEIIDHQLTGQLVEPGSALALQRALLDMLADDAYRQACGMRAREKVLRDFTIDRMVSGNLGLYAVPD
ncbi:MAG: hypothetical protein RIQ52_592 [Pseudomonadota bacterium]